MLSLEDIKLYNILLVFCERSEAMTSLPRFCSELISSHELQFAKRARATPAFNQNFITSFSTDYLLSYCIFFLYREFQSTRNVKNESFNYVFRYLVYKAVNRYQMFSCAFLNNLESSDTVKESICFSHFVQQNYNLNRLKTWLKNHHFVVYESYACVSPKVHAPLK